MRSLNLNPLNETCVHFGRMHLTIHFWQILWRLRSLSFKFWKKNGPGAPMQRVTSLRKHYYWSTAWSLQNPRSMAPYAGGWNHNKSLARRRGHEISATACSGFLALWPSQFARFRPARLGCGVRPAGRAAARGREPCTLIELEGSLPQRRGAGYVWLSRTPLGHSAPAGRTSEPPASRPTLGCGVVPAGLAHQFLAGRAAGTDGLSAGSPWRFPSAFIRASRRGLRRTSCTGWQLVAGLVVE
jgi:hypothetical protein